MASASRFLFASWDILVLNWSCINASINISSLLYPHSLSPLSSLCARGSPFIYPFGWCLTLTRPAAPTKSGYLAAGLIKMVLPRSTGPRFITKKDDTDTASSGVRDRRSLVTAVPCSLVSPFPTHLPAPSVTRPLWVGLGVVLYWRAAALHVFGSILKSGGRWTFLHFWVGQCTAPQ